MQECRKEQQRCLPHQWKQPRYGAPISLVVVSKATSPNHKRKHRVNYLRRNTPRFELGIVSASNLCRYLVKVEMVRSMAQGLTISSAGDECAPQNGSSRAMRVLGQGLGHAAQPYALVSPPRLRWDDLAGRLRRLLHVFDFCHSSPTRTNRCRQPKGILVNRLSTLGLGRREAWLPVSTRVDGRGSLATEGSDSYDTRYPLCLSDGAGRWCCPS